MILFAQYSFYSIGIFEGPQTAGGMTERSHTRCDMTIDHSDQHPNESEFGVQRSLESRKPSTRFIFLCLLVTRLLSSLYNIIHDCDEVYNYWEPLHFLLYGYGMQTWEYRYCCSMCLLCQLSCVTLSTALWHHGINQLAL